jgi:outer membrane lipoprotein-sorting protein
MAHQIPRAEFTEETMRAYRCIPAVAALLALILAWPVMAGAAERTGREILNKVDDLYRGDSAHGRMHMHIVTEHWERTLKLAFWSKGKEYSLIRILEPLKEKGTATLRVENELWNYLPKVERVIKLPSSMMSASWMGSHFTNDDLVKESRMTEDYSFEITFEGRKDGREVIEITCRPKPEAPVVWGKLLVTVRPKDFLPYSIEYYDEDLDLARTMIFDRIVELDDRTIPARTTMLPEDKPDEKTKVTYEAIDFNVDIDRSFFSIRNLRD